MDFTRNTISSYWIWDEIIVSVKRENSYWKVRDAAPNKGGGIYTIISDNKSRSIGVSMLGRYMARGHHSLILLSNPSPTRIWEPWTHIPASSAPLSLMFLSPVTANYGLKEMWSRHIKDWINHNQKLTFDSSFLSRFVGTSWQTMICPQRKSNMKIGAWEDRSGRELENIHVLPNLDLALYRKQGIPFNNCKSCWI